MRERLAAAESSLRVRDLEIEELTLVIERNRKRVESELGCYAAEIVASETPKAQPTWHSRTAS